jgi:YD repeat-containing protein
LTQLTDDASLNTTFAYDPTDKLTSRTLPNGVATSYQYDGLDRLTRLTHSKAGNTLADFQYQFNAVNNITQMTDGAGSHDYAYDPLDRLTAATHPSQTNESYTFDDVGNRTASHQGSSYSYQTFNRLVTANSNQYGYDSNGNLTSKTDASGSWTYTWDYENRLKQTSRSGGVTVTYSYDAFGRRIQRTSTTGGTTKFVYDGADVLRDLDGNGNTIADYLDGPGIDNKLRQTSGGTALYFIQDHLATTRARADASGSIATNLTYDSFGNLLTGSISTRYTYTGREIDTDTGLMYYRERWYDAALKTTSYEYNARSQQTAVVDANNQRYEFGSDALGHRTEERKGTATMSFVYDPAGNRSQRTDCNNAVTNYTSDALNRLTTISYPDLTAATYGYDELSRLTTATNPNSTVTNAYDNHAEFSSGNTFLYLPRCWLYV